jgi:hypothetical protein
MIVERINTFSAFIMTIQEDPSPKMLRFTSAHASAAEFIVARENIFYTSEIKHFDQWLYKFLKGEVQCSYEPYNGQVDVEGLYLDIYHIVWDSVAKIPSESISTLFDNIETITAKRVRATKRDFTEFSKDALDSLVIFYHHHVPKPLEMILEGFSLPERKLVLHSIARLSLLGFIHLFETAAQQPFTKEIPRSTSTVRQADGPPKKQPEVQHRDPILERELVLTEQLSDGSDAEYVAKSFAAKNSSDIKKRVDGLHKILKVISQMKH